MKAANTDLQCSSNQLVLDLSAYLIYSSANSFLSHFIMSWHPDVYRSAICLKLVFIVSWYPNLCWPLYSWCSDNLLLCDSRLLHNYCQISSTCNCCSYKSTYCKSCQRRYICLVMVMMQRWQMVNMSWRRCWPKRSWSSNCVASNQHTSKHYKSLHCQFPFISVNVLFFMPVMCPFSTVTNKMSSSINLGSIVLYVNSAFAGREMPSNIWSM